MEARATFNYTANDPATELSFQKNDRLLILNYGDPVQWYDAQHNGLVGQVPRNYIEVTNAPWYYARISRTYAEKLLRISPHDGAFLVRLSETSPKDFSLSVKSGQTVQHFRILSVDNQYFLWATRFNSLNELVENYRHETVSRNNHIVLRDMEWENTYIAEAMYDFEPDEEGNEAGTELGFRRGDLIQVCDCRDENWWSGRIGEREGFFPRTYVERWPNPNPFTKRPGDMDNAT